MSIKLINKTYRNSQEQILKNAQDIEELKAGTILIPDGAVTAPKIAGNAVTTDKLALNAVSTEKIQDQAVTTAKIKDSAVTTEKIASESVTTGKIADGAVITDKIDDDSVTTDKIVNGAVTYQKLDVDLKEEVNFGISERLKTVNLFNKATYNANKYIKADGTLGTDSDVSCSDYIEVKANTNYSNNLKGSWVAGLGVAFYDNSKTFISGYAPNVSEYNNFTTPATTKYIRIAWISNSSDPDYYTNVDTIMLNEGSTVQAYQPYNGQIIHKIDIDPVLLWENANPTSAFSSSTITVEDMSKYKYIVILAKHYYSGRTNQVFKLIYSGIGSEWAYISFNDQNIYSRGLRFDSNTSINVADAYENSTIDNQYCIPVAIYGTNIL